MQPGDDVTVAPRRKTRQKKRWYKPNRCSVCTRFLWLHSIALEEPVEAPEPRQEWTLCKPCYKALLVEMSRSSIRLAARLRVAMGLVAAERSPLVNSRLRMEREFSWVMWLLVLFTLLHVVIFAILFSIPR
jgi:hypothetical protein